ncbi:MAG: hypothetical protein IIX04_01815 [Alistipes sp.]|nr:hypothetical protein [Alistipes sp.]MBR0393826.1 hypothetical protein [Alistipes sp.]
MKKIFAIVAVATLFASCSVTAPTSPSMAKLTNTSTHSKVQIIQPVVAILADLEVSPTKISYFFLPSQTVVNGGFDNIVNTAVREALIANGNADVLVALEQQVKYNGEGKVESITVSGYPAKYTNFRSPGDDYLRSLSTKTPKSGNEGKAAGGSSLLGALKLGK